MPGGGRASLTRTLPYATARQRRPRSLRARFRRIIVCPIGNDAGLKARCASPPHHADGHTRRRRLMSKQLVRFLACSLVTTAAAFTAHAQEYPAKPVRVVIPWPAGGSND